MLFHGVSTPLIRTDEKQIHHSKLEFDQFVAFNHQFKQY